MTQSVHVIAVLETKPGHRDDLLAAFSDNLEAVHAEQGCITYVPTVDHAGSPAAFGPNTVVVVEEWATMDDLKAHGRAPHMAAFTKRIEGIMASKAIHIVQPAS